MKKIYLIILILFIFNSCAFGFFWDKKPKPILILSPNDPRKETQVDKLLEYHSVFKKGDRIYFLVHTQKGFKSNYIKYQIVKQDDKAHVGGYTRIKNQTVRIKNKNNYVDYFVLTEAGKYIIQIFDIENLHQWITYGEFRVVD